MVLELMIYPGYYKVPPQKVESLISKRVADGRGMGGVGKIGYGTRFSPAYPGNWIR